MSFLSKLFLILSILTSILFLIVASALLAKQQNYQAREAKELIERQRDEQLQEQLRHHLAAIKDRNQRQVQLARTRTLIAANAANVAASEGQQFAEALQVVRDAVNNFSVGLDFRQTEQDYGDTLNRLVERTGQLAERMDDISSRRADLIRHLAQAESELARLGEHINVLDTELYELRRSNVEFREVANLYLEADNTLTAPGLGGPLRPSGRVRAVNMAEGTVSIDVGENEEVQPNMILTVVDQRTGEYRGQIEITEVYQHRSVGRIVPRMLHGTIEPGNRVQPPALGY